MPMDDRLPPHDIEAEEAVIAACLVDPQAIPECIAVARPEMFFREKHGEIFAAIIDLWSKGEDVNQITVAHALSRRPSRLRDGVSALDDAGGQVFLAEIQRRLATSIGAGWYAEIVRRDWRYRRLITLSSSITQMAFEAPPEIDGVYERAMEMLLREGVDRSRVLTRSVGEVLIGTPAKRGTAEDDGLVAEIDRWLEEPNQIRGYLTGWSELDYVLNGLEPTRVYTIVGDTSVGKSALVQWMLLNLASAGVPVLLFSTEMSAPEVTERLVYMRAGVDPQAIRGAGEATEDQLTAIYAAESELTTMPIYICDVGGINLATLTAEARRQTMIHGVRVIALDHIQHVTVDGAAGVQRIEAVTAGAKSLAMNLDVPWLQISHPNRESARSGVLDIHSGKGGSSIEQDTNVFVALTPVRFEPGGWVQMTADEADAFVGKNNFIHIRADVGKNRSGVKSWSVRRFDRRHGLRFEPIGQPRQQPADPDTSDVA